MPTKEKIIAAGKYIFLAGVAFLIVRNNSYPFFIKRSSDVLFFLSATLVFYTIFRFKEGYKNFFEHKDIRNALTLIFLGIATASLSGYFLNDLGFTKEGVLNIGRFSEIFIILFLASFFQGLDANFYKKAALAQLSTLIYLPTLLFPNAAFVIAMYRFNLFENWPSNVGYYLIVSITCIAVLAIERIQPFKKTFWIYYALGIGLFAIFLWAQSRASWLGALTSIFLLIIFYAGKNYKKIVASLFLFIFVLTFAFAILRPYVQNAVLARIFSGNIEMPNSTDSELPGFNPNGGILNDSSRLQLWKIYSEKLLASPLGFGVNYEPVDIGNGKQGPHNTVLEFLVLAGPLGLAGFILLFWSALKNLLGRIKGTLVENRIWYAYLFCSLVGLVIASIFDNMSLFRLMWLVIGFAIAV